MTIGHPDFLSTVSPAPPQFIQALASAAAGTSFGPVNVPVPSGGSYHLALFPLITSQFCCADITISHLDSRGAPTWQDFFGGILIGNGLAGLNGNCNAAVVRGNIYGTTLQISGTVAASAFLNAVIPGHAFTAAGLNINVYTTPFALPDPQPHIVAGAANVNSFTSGTPQGFLAVIGGGAVNFGTTFGPLPVLTYAGPATLEVEQEGVTTGTNMLMLLTSWTVAGGSANFIVQRRFKPLPNLTSQLFQLQLQPFLHTYSIVNSDGAQNATVYMSMTAGKAA